MVAFFFPPLISKVKSVTYLSLVQDTSTDDSYTFSSYAIGAPAADRRIFGFIHWNEGGTHFNLDTVTIGGINAPVIAQRGHTGGVTGLGVAIVSAVVPTGTTATVVISNDSPGFGNWTGAAFSALRTTGMTRSTAFDTDTDEHQGTTADLTASTNIDSSGLIMAVMTGSTNAVNDSVTWTGANEQYDQAGTIGVHLSMAWQSGLGAETGRSIIADIVPRINSGNDMAVVSWS